MRPYAKENKYSKTATKDQLISDDLQLLEQEICGGNDDAADNVTTPWTGFKVNPLDKLHISVVHEVDEKSVDSRSRTPGSCLVKLEAGCSTNRYLDKL